ncbi:hypothetical protein V8E51_008350 [Hyaloscypha variabilis]
MLFQRVAIIFAMALTTLAQSALASPSACEVYTVVESAFAINACFTLNTVISIESVTPVYVTNAPTCITTVVTASTTLSPSDANQNSATTLLRSIRAQNTLATISATLNDAPSVIQLSSSALSTPTTVVSPITTASPLATSSSTTFTSAAPSSSTCNVAPPLPTQEGTTPYCCEWYIVQPGDTCEIITSGLGITAGTIYELNPELYADCYNLALGNAYCVSGSPQIVPAPTLFYILAEDSSTVADGEVVVGGHSDHAIMGFNLPWGEEPLTFTYDPATGFLETEGYYVYAIRFTDSGPLLLVTYTASDGMNTPGAYPLVCIVTLGQKLYCQVDGGAYDRLYLFSYSGQLGLGIDNGTITHVAALDLFLESA